MNKNFGPLYPRENFVQFQKVWYPRNQLDEVYQMQPVHHKVRKKRAHPNNAHAWILVWASLPGAPVPTRSILNRMREKQNAWETS